MGLRGEANDGTKKQATMHGNDRYGRIDTQGSSVKKNQRENRF
jgi:hypothetical protein